MVLLRDRGDEAHRHPAGDASAELRHLPVARIRRRGPRWAPSNRRSVLARRWSAVIPLDAAVEQLSGRAPPSSLAICMLSAGCTMLKPARPHGVTFLSSAQAQEILHLLDFPRTSSCRSPVLLGRSSFQNDRYYNQPLFVLDDIGCLGLFRRLRKARIMGLSTANHGSGTTTCRTRRPQAADQSASPVPRASPYGRAPCLQTGCGMPGSRRIW